LARKKRRRKEERKKERKKPQGKNITACPIAYGAAKI